VVPQILRTIRGWQQKDPNLKVTFAGHSMGTIVLNEAFRAMDDNAGGNSRNCSVRVDKVIYLAGACSLRDFSDTAGRYLEKNKNCQLYAVCLHPKREVGEKLMPYAPLVYSGSLLTWIDQFFQNPRDFPDRTFGSFENCIIAYKYLPQTPRFHLKCFDDNESFFNKLRPESGPQKHGQMGEFRFWDPVFYQPVKNGERPYYSLAPIPALTRAAH
jgi:pimeloyl-ACP methyl ester carboxylesterase